MEPDDPSEEDRKEKYEHQKALHAAYVAQHVKCDNFALEIGARYEKMLSLISGGALLVSLTFIEKIAPSPVPWSRWLALAAWVLLASAITASLVALYHSQNAVRKKMGNLDIEIQKALRPDDKELQEKDATHNPYTEKVTRANWTSLSCTVAGIVAVILFAFFNFPPPTKSNDKADESTKSGLNTSFTFFNFQSSTNMSDADQADEPKESALLKEGSYIPVSNQVPPPPPPPPPPSKDKEN